MFSTTDKIREDNQAQTVLDGCFEHGLGTQGGF